MRNATSRLRRAMESGQVIVCSMAPYEGEPMKYLPRHTRDPRPWVLVGQAHARDPFRYSGLECHVHTPREV
jgi:hypothetical protein